MYIAEEYKIFGLLIQQLLHQKLTKHDCRSKEKPIDFRNMENGQIHRIH